MNQQSLAERINSAIEQHHYTVQRFFQEAFKWRFGPDRRNDREADLAAKRFAKMGTLSKRTMDAIQRFMIHQFGMALRNT